ncbi:MmcQ/YjbR family DNA-binding protein [Pseudonocardia eucalypti]|uniref:MmcQ/YjbR family DNA-binding protein n=1 Tax=Pseudonocardia eucalypti TaxID=648755 RepID=A0ABP9QEB6_9PSEU|nr:hypothetical protein [Pseudonocardia eucalypti]
MTTAEAVREYALTLPRTTLGYVGDGARFRIGRIVYLAFSPDEQIMGFAYPKLERAALVEAEPDKFRLPRPSSMRYNWVDCRLAAIDDEEMRELVTEAWRMCVPKRVAAEHLGS